jgi:hypothetical protein
MRERRQKMKTKQLAHDSEPITAKTATHKVAVSHKPMKITSVLGFE